MNEQDDDQKDPECMGFQDGMEAVEAWEAKMMDEYGWIIHYVPCDDEQSPTGFNAHTHGCEETFNHPDLQIVLPLHRKVAHGVFHTIIDRIKEGDKFEAGDVSEDILQGDYKVKFIEAIECGRTLLRVILPDKDGSIEEMDMNANRLQYDKTHELI